MIIVEGSQDFTPHVPTHEELVEAFAQYSLWLIDREAAGRGTPLLLSICHDHS